MSTDLKKPLAASARQMHRQTQLMEARSEARSKLPLTELLRFENWLMEEMDLRTRTKSFRARLDVLYETPREVVVLPLQESFPLVQQILERNHAQVVDQLRSVGQVHQHLSMDKFADATKSVREHRSHYGATFWAAEAEIAIANRASSSEDVRNIQKRLSGNQRGLVRFFLSAAATRSDAAELSTRQVALLGRRVGNSGLNAAQKIHAHFRATASVPESESDLATVLAYELLLPPLDAVLTALSLAYTICARPGFVATSARDAAVRLLSQYGTPLLGIPIPKSEIGSSQPLVCADLSRFIRRAVLGLLSNQEYRPSTNADGLEGAIAAQLTADDASAREWLHHFVVCFPSHPWSIQLRPALPLRTLVELVRDISERRSIAGQAPARVEISRAFVEGIAAHTEPTFKLLIDPIEAKEAQRLQADSEFERRGEALSKTTRDCLEVALSWTLFKVDLQSESMRVALRTGLRNQRVVESTPLVSMFEGKSWRHLKSMDDLFQLSCALQLYHAATGDPQAKTTKRFAVAALMKQEECSDLASLVIQLGSKGKLDPTVNHFFVTQVLDLPLIELLGIVDGTDEAQQELLRVLRAGAALPGVDKLGLESRVAEFEHGIAVARAKGTIDATKVFVGESELIQKAIQEYQVTYEHYQQLIEERPLGDVDLEALLRLRPTDLDSEIGDAQRLLHEIMTGVLELFLNDPSVGLDSVIGRRIRHGTITGELRGTLDHIGMISHRPKAGAHYEVSKRIRDELSAYPTRLQSAVSAALARFSVSIDSLCQVLCDEVFQCQRQSSTARLKPAFALEINARNFSGLFHMALKAQPFDEFLDICFAMFWMGIHGNIERERPNIEAYVRRTLKDACTRLKTDLRSLNLPDRLLIDRAQRAYDEMLLKGETVLSWVAVPKADETAAVLILSVVAHGSDMLVRGQHTDFAPSVTIDASAELLSIDNGMLLHDTLYILFDNAAKHSKLNRPEIRVVIDSEGGTLKVSFSCGMSPSVFSDLEKGRLAAVQAEIVAKGAASIAKRNKGSGLGKLSSLTSGRGGMMSMTLKKDSASLMTEFDLPLYVRAAPVISESPP